MLTYTQGKTLGPGDLSILFRDTNGALFDPATVTYTIFALDDNGNPTSPMIPPGVAAVPSRFSTGSYYIPITIPTVWLGNFRAVWSAQQFSSSDPVSTITIDFVVQMIDPATGSFEAPSAIIAQTTGLNQNLANIVMMVRELLSDTNPDRNYHFRPPTPGKQVAGYTNRIGYIWLDSTILRMLDLTIAQLNSWNPKNFYSNSLTNIPVDWAKCAALGAAAKCLSAEAARWTADEFSYSLNGVSLDINKASMYQQLSSAYAQEFQVWAPLITANRPVSAGLRQQRWLL